MESCLETDDDEFVVVKLLSASSLLARCSLRRTLVLQNNFLKVLDFSIFRWQDSMEVSTIFANFRSHISSPILWQLLDPVKGFEKRETRLRSAKKKNRFAGGKLIYRSIIEALYRNKERIETRLIRLSFGPINPPIISLLSNGTKAGSLRIIVPMTRQFPKFIIQTDIINYRI